MTSSIGADRKTQPLSMSLAWIVPQTGDLEGKIFPLRDQLTVGSGPGASVTLGDRGIAAVHASFHLIDGCWFVEDARSGKETRVLDRQLAAGERLPLNDDDTITFGSTLTVFKRL